MKRPLTLLVACLGIPGDVATGGERCADSGAQRLGGQQGNHERVDVVVLGDLEVKVQGAWLHVSRGNDEERQEVRMAIWAREAFGADLPLTLHGFHQLDDDPEREYVVVSRSPGTGPYYRLQIVDLPPHGISTWSYHSGGKPRIEGSQVFLGRLKNGYESAATQVEYSAYKFTPEGLVLE